VGVESICLKYDINIGNIEMKEIYIYIFIILLICILAVFYKNRNYDSTIFTCTTFFDFEKQDKWQAFCQAMDSIFELHDPATLQKIDKWLIVNEYSTNPKRDWTATVQERYPFIKMIQKNKAQKGQATSMNIILQHIRPYTYWIHWEETWYCRRPCLDRMFEVIQESPDLSQLQVTQHKEKPNWLDSDAHPRIFQQTSRGTGFYRIFPAKGTDVFLQKSVDEYNKDYIGKWPLYSLLPSINRCAHNQFGEFSANPKHWPFRFEWDYGKRWLLAGNTKAVLPDGPVVRDNSAHKSTYV
jgi:hypothetical protein